KTAKEQVEVAQKLYGIYKTLESVTGVMLSLTKHGIDSESLRQAQTDKNNDFIKLLIAEFDRVKLNLDPYNWEVITGSDDKVNKYKNPLYSFLVRDKEIQIDTLTECLAHTQIPK